MKLAQLYRLVLTLACAAFLTAMLAGCGGSGGGSSNGSNPDPTRYWPISPAEHSWTFTGNMQIICRGQTTFQGQTCYQMDFISDGNSTPNYFRWTSSPSNLQCLGFTDMGNGYGVDSPPGIEIPANITPGYNWQQNITNHFYDLNGNLSRSEAHSVSASIIGIEPITVPAGSFNNALHIHATDTYNGNTEIGDFWYVPDIGPVQTIQSGQTYSLISYTTGT